MSWLEKYKSAVVGGDDFRVMEVIWTIPTTEDWRAIVAWEIARADQKIAKTTK